MRLLVIVLLAGYLFSAIGFADDAEPKSWEQLVEQYKLHMVVGEWNGAIQTAETLIHIDKSSSEARFYLVRAVLKTGAEYPKWVGRPSSWSYDTIQNRYYVELAKDLGYES